MASIITMTSFFVAIALVVSSHAACDCNCKNAVLFNVGDSNSDTGGSNALLPNTHNYPNGRTFFRQPTGRLCDGRLILDFYAEYLKIGYATPYLQSLKPNFKHGANFALSGSSVTPRENSPYVLETQLLQFAAFYNRSLLLRLQGHDDVLSEDDFRNALYIFDIGQNDLKYQFDMKNTSTKDNIREKTQAMVSRIKKEIEGVYENGGRNFWVHNTGPLGCLPSILDNMKPNRSQVDEYGCIASMNEAAQEFNSKLKAMCEDLRLELQDSNIVYVDIYAIKYNLIANSSSYGFEKPLMACCGKGGPPYNAGFSIMCGSDGGYNVCGEEERFISWDGVHYTDAANSIITSMILSTNYSSPPLQLSFFWANST